MKTGQLRQTFLEFFKGWDHTIVESSSLVPDNDPTLLFTNAGMVQFKDTFLGLEQRPYQRATSSQRCVRAGGKHNDLENVGYTARHHTFFEMLGNFSFGDYFKREAIQYAWDFLTNVLKIPKERLWITVYEKDDEAARIWLEEMKIDKNRFSRCGEKDNFWAMGDTGPCGPCSEIFYDHGPAIAGGPPGSKDEDGDRYVEIWNLVFMQFNRSEDGTLTPLPKPSVDTGMGLERIAAVMQGVHSNYDIDIFKALIKAIAELGNIHDLNQPSLRVIADHIRSCAFLIVDGVTPSNEGRGYVLRRIIRRAVRHGHRLGFKETFFYALVKPLAEVMGEAYPALEKMRPHVERVLQQEEEQFARTLEQGLKILEQDIANMSGNLIPGETVFKLYDTYGFPVDLTADIARERGLSLDMAGFNDAMAAQKARAREASQFAGGYTDRVETSHSTDFTGYETLEQKVTVVGLYREGKPVEKLFTDEEGIVVLDSTPFYAEAGGQVGDQGVLQFGSGEFLVKNTQKSGQAHMHIGVIKEGELTLGDHVNAVVDSLKRRRTALNHSATHLLHAALRKLLGTHIQQKGSLVEPSRLRFDYTHPKALLPSEIRAIEHLVNEQIRLNTEVETEIMPVSEAQKSGAMALFGEKYGESVRVLRMGGDFSMELCGGTHVARTGDIGLFKITSETGISAGVRRIEAITGEAAMAYLDNMQDSLFNISNILKCNKDAISEKIDQLLAKTKQLEKENQQLKKGLLQPQANNDLSTNVKEIEGVKVLAAELPMGDPKSLREMVDTLKDKLKTAVIVLAAVNDGKVSLVAGVTRDITTKVNAGDLMNELAEKLNGKGGGRPDMAQGGGNHPEKLREVMDFAYHRVEELLR